MTQDREALARCLARVAHDTVIQWMRNVEMPDGLDAYLSWSDDGTFVLGEYGRFKLNVSVTAIPGPAQIEESAEWITTTWRYVLLDDRVRLGESEAEVTACNTGVWHADTSDYWHPKPWEHTEVKVQLKHTGEVWLPWPPDSEVEIFMDSARRAVYVLQQSFEGTREVKRCDASVSTSSHVTPGSAFTSPRKQSTFARFRSWSSDGCAR